MNYCLHMSFVTSSSLRGDYIDLLCVFLQWSSRHANCTHATGASFRGEAPIDQCWITRHRGNVREVKRSIRVGLRRLSTTQKISHTHGRRTWQWAFRIQIFRTWKMQRLCSTHFERTQVTKTIICDLIFCARAYARSAFSPSVSTSLSSLA